MTGDGDERPGPSGYRPVYRQGEINHCPGCGHVQWMVGRFSAECAHCGTAIPLIESSGISPSKGQAAEDR